MTLVVAWVLLPALLAALSFGCGGVVEVAAGLRLGSGLRTASGFGLLLTLVAAPAVVPGAAQLSLPLLVAVAIVGVVLAPPRLALPARDVVAPAAAAAATFVLLSLPIVLSGRATFAGYIKLDDTATYLAMLDRAQAHGYDTSGMTPSTYDATVATSLAYGYPLASFLPVADAHALLRIDAAWLWQPYIAFIGAMLALALYAALEGVRSRTARAAAAVVSSLPSLVVGYYLWGGVKELCAAFLLVLLGVGSALLLRGAARGWVVAAIAVAGLADVLSVGGAVWALPALVAAGILVWRTRGRGLGRTAAAIATAVVLAIPALVAAVRWLPRAGGFRSGDELGNLAGPVSLRALAGVWPAGDFRNVPVDLGPADVLAAVVVVAAVAGCVWLARTRIFPLLFAAAGGAAGVAVLRGLASPWVGGKALATAAPLVVALACVAAAALAQSGRRIEGGILAVAILGGIGWSDALAYRAVWLAPSGRLSELAAIGSRYAGEGPALMTEFDPYGARHFLRGLDAEGESELRRRTIPLRTGGPVPPQGYADLDELALDGVEVYRTLVLRRSPVASRPPSTYRLVETRDWYAVWQRPPGAAPPVDHLPLGTTLDPGAVPRCADVRALAARPGVRTLSAAEAPPVQAYALTALRHPAGWSSGGGGTLLLKRGGTLTTRIDVPASGRYSVWLGGSVAGRVTAALDGHATGSAQHELQWNGQYLDLGGRALARGAHTLELRYRGADWRPGSAAGGSFPVGPLLVAEDGPRALVTVAATRAATLCGRRWDWIDALR